MTFDLQTWSFMEVSQSHQCLEHLWKPLKLSGNIPEELCQVILHGIGLDVCMPYDSYIQQVPSTTSSLCNPRPRGRSIGGHSAQEECN